MEWEVGTKMQEILNFTEHSYIIIIHLLCTKQTIRHYGHVNVYWANLLIKTKHSPLMLKLVYIIYSCWEAKSTSILHPSSNPIYSDEQSISDLKVVIVAP